MTRRRSWFVLVAASLLTAAASAEEPPAAAPSYKAVPIKTLTQQRIKGDTPRLPDWAKLMYAGRSVQGTYLEYIERDGSVSRVDVLASIPKVDDFIIATVKTWRYKPQGVPIRTMVNFAFTIEPAGR